MIFQKRKFIVSITVMVMVMSILIIPTTSYAESQNYKKGYVDGYNDKPQSGKGIDYDLGYNTGQKDSLSGKPPNIQKMI